MEGFWGLEPVAGLGGGLLGYWLGLWQDFELLEPVTWLGEGLLFVYSGSIRKNLVFKLQWLVSFL